MIERHLPLLAESARERRARQAKPTRATIIKSYADWIIERLSRLERDDMIAVLRKAIKSARALPNPHKPVGRPPKWIRGYGIQMVRELKLYREATGSTKTQALRDLSEMWRERFPNMITTDIMRRYGEAEAWVKHQRERT